nr:hypothetical protein [Tanacetum cinerariifolium]
ISARKEVDIGLGGGCDKPLRLADMLLYSWDEGIDVCVDLTGSSHLTQTSMVYFVSGCAVIDATHRNRPTEDVLPWPDNANMAFDSRPTKDVLPWLGSANMTFDLWPTEDVLPWLGSANIAFDLRPTEDPMKDVLSWLGSANLAFDLRPTKDVLSWPGSANVAFDLVPDLKCLLQDGSCVMTKLIYDLRVVKLKRSLETVHANSGSAAHMHGASHYELNLHRKIKLAIVKQPQRYGYKDERADIRFVGNQSSWDVPCGQTESMTADTKKENMSGRAEYHGRTETMTADTKKENMSGRAEYHGRTGPMTADTKKENMPGHGRTDPMTADTNKENMPGRAEIIANKG